MCLVLHCIRVVGSLLCYMLVAFFLVIIERKRRKEELNTFEITPFGVKLIGVKEAEERARKHPKRKITFTLHHIENKEKERQRNVFQNRSEQIKRKVKLKYGPPFYHFSR